MIRLNTLTCPKDVNIKERVLHKYDVKLYGETLKI
jgi:hypothetical protein